MKCRSPFIVFVGIHSGKSTFYNDDHNGSAGVVYAEPDEVVESLMLSVTSYILLTMLSIISAGLRSMLFHLTVRSVSLTNQVIR